MSNGERFKRCLVPFELRAFRLPQVELRLPIVTEGGAHDVRQRAPAHPHHAKRECGSQKNRGEQDKKPRLNGKIQHETEPSRDGDINELPDGEKTDDLILRFDKLWNLELHGK